MNNLINFTDPSGHCTLGGHWMPDNSSACGWSSNNQGSISGQGNGGFVNSGGNGNRDDDPAYGDGLIGPPAPTVNRPPVPDGYIPPEVLLHFGSSNFFDYTHTRNK